MAGTSETYNTTGGHVAIGDNNTMNVTYHGALPPLPPGLPAGRRVVVRCEVVVGDASGAVASTPEVEEHPHQTPQLPQQHQQRRPPSQPLQRPLQKTRQVNLSQSYAEQLQQRPSQRAQQQRSAQLHQQQSGQSHLQQTQHQRQGAHHQQQVKQQYHTQPNVNQSPTSGSSVRQPQQETSPPGQHPSSRQRLPRQQPGLSKGQDQLLTQEQRQGQPQAYRQQGNGRPTTGVRQFRKQTDEPSIELLYSRHPMSDLPAMHQEPQATSGNPGLTIVESGQANSGHYPTIKPSSTVPSSDQNTRPKTPVSISRSYPDSNLLTPSYQIPVKSIPYSLNPNECPKEACTDESITQLPVLPKSETCSSELPTIHTKILEDAHPPDISDIIVFKITSVLVLIVSDMANSCIRSVKNIHGVSPKVQCIILPSQPIALCHIKGDNILVSYCHVMQFSFINITKMMIQQTFKTKRQYSGIAIIRETNGNDGSCKHTAVTDAFKKLRRANEIGFVGIKRLSTLFWQPNYL